MLMARNTNKTDVFVATVDWELDFATFTSISAYSGYDMKSPGNTDMSAAPGLARTRSEDYEQYSQEIRFVSPGGETIDWIAGAYYQYNNLKISSTFQALDFAQSGPISVPPLYADLQQFPSVPSKFDQDSYSWSAFGQGTWNYTECPEVFPWRTLQRRDQRPRQGHCL